MRAAATRHQAMPAEKTNPASPHEDGGGIAGAVPVNRVVGFSAAIVWGGGRAEKPGGREFPPTPCQTERGVRASIHIAPPTSRCAWPQKGRAIVDNPANTYEVAPKYRVQSIREGGATIRRPGCAHDAHRLEHQANSSRTFRSPRAARLFVFE
jgi:hypothetical protein